MGLGLAPSGSQDGTLTTLAITGISPSSGSTLGGETVTITGRGFELGMTAKINGVLCTSLVVISANTLTCVTPAGTVGAQDVRLDRVTTAANATLAGGFEYIFSPGDIANLELWYEAGLGTTTSGGKVTALANQGILAGADLTQATSADQPTYNSADAGYNNQPTMTFADATDHLISSGGFGPMGANVGTLFFIGSVGEATALHAAFDLYSPGTAAHVIIGLDPGGWPTTYTDAGLTIVISALTTKNIVISTINGATSHTAKNTRATVGADAAITTTVGTKTDLQFRLGTNYINTQSWGDIAPGKIAAVLWYSRVLSNTEIDDIIAHYKTKYSIP